MSLKTLLPLILVLFLLVPTFAFADEAAPPPSEDGAVEETTEIITEPTETATEPSEIPEEPSDPYTSFDGSDTEPLETVPPATEENTPIESQDSNTPTQESTEPTQVIEVIDHDYNGPLTAILQEIQGFSYTAQLIASFLLFFVVVILCYFSYKFFKIFF